MATTPSAAGLTCPRCSQPLDQEFYGPCGPCRDDLRASQAREAEQLETPRYEPSMHVTPNAVALKE